MTSIEQGCIDIWIDEIVPCLKDTETGDIKEIVVFKIESRTYLKKFLANKRLKDAYKERVRFDRKAWL